MTLDAAAAKWWAEKGEGLRSSEDRDRQIAMLVTIIGGKTRLAEIDTKKVGDAIQKRRKMPYRKGGKGEVTLPSNATVNRDMIDALRPILRRARRSWGAKGLPEIDWGELRLPEPKPKPKELVGDELDQVLSKLRPYWHDLVRFCARYGPRIGEAFFPLSALDIEDRDNARIVLRDRKGGDDHIIPLLPEDAAMFAARAGRARAADLDTVWFREEKSGKLKALKPGGAIGALSTAMTETGLREAKGMRGSHDLRRSSAMKFLRATKNLAATQKLLGHVSIQSTLVYAHALEDDVKQGLAAVSRKNPEPSSVEGGKAEENKDVKAG